MRVLSTESTSDDAAPQDIKADGNTLSSTKSEGETIIRITPDGDLILDVQTSYEDVHTLYQVNTTQLRDSSPYFRNLLDPQKFSEGARVTAVQDTLRERFSSREAVPLAELPRISIVDIGHLSSRVKPQTSMTAFLCILLGVPKAFQSSPSWLVNLVAIADRFDCMHKVKEHVEHYPLVYTTLTNKWLNAKFKEEPVRQLLLSGMLLGMPEWITSYSARMIIHGSERWGAVTDQEPKELWWYLSGGLEGR